MATSPGGPHCYSEGGGPGGGAASPAQHRALRPDPPLARGRQQRRGTQPQAPLSMGPPLPPALPTAMAARGLAGQRAGRRCAALSAVRHRCVQLPWNHEEDLLTRLYLMRRSLSSSPALLLPPFTPGGEDLALWGSLTAPASSHAFLVLQSDTAHQSMLSSLQ